MLIKNKLQFVLFTSSPISSINPNRFEVHSVHFAHNVIIHYQYLSSFRIVGCNAVQCHTELPIITDDEQTIDKKDDALTMHISRDCENFSPNGL